jgi:hypothetical protein
VHWQSDAGDLSIFRLLGGNGTSEALIFDWFFLDRLELVRSARPIFGTSLPFEI